MTTLRDPIDYENLERELHESLCDEELYILQNDAKFRAIEQAVPTYEDFREMVNAAHLKPLDRKDMTPKYGVKWNSVASDRNSNHNQRSIKSLDQQSVMQISSNKIPKNTHEFRQKWRQLAHHDEKFQLLIDTRLAFRDEIFRSEIPPDILSDCLITCRESLEGPANINLVIDILFTLSECCRFNLAVSFMSDHDKSVCNDLFQILRQATIPDNRNIDMLANKYCK